MLQEYPSFTIRPRAAMPIDEQRERIEKLPYVVSVTYYAKSPHFFRIAWHEVDDNCSPRYMRTLCAAALEVDPESLRCT